MKSFKTLLITLLLTSSSIFSQIIEVHSFSSIEEHIQDDTMILYDIDNTILNLAQSFGGDTWFQNYKEMLIGQGLSYEEAVNQTLDKWIPIQSVSKVNLVEEYIPFIIRKYQDKQNVSIGFTTRGFSMGRQTIRQLADKNIYFSQTSPHPMPISFNNEVRFTGEPCIFYKGVFFTAGSHKGSALFELLERMDYTPSHILFINDKLQNIEEVAEYCEAKGIPFTGLRYGYLDNWVESFNLDIALIQDELFGEVISDYQAFQILTSLQLTE